MDELKAVILNSGVGSRMGDLTTGNPKCLVRISESETILSHQIRLLRSCGIGEFVITTGPFPDQIRERVAKDFPGLNVQYVHNPKFATTNYIYSMHLAADVIVDDVLLLHGDLVADSSVCELCMQAGDAVVVNAHVPPPEKDFKGELRDGRVDKIAVYLDGPNCVFLLPMYKLSKSSMRIWMDEIARFVARGNTKVYAEEAFNVVSARIPLAPAYMAPDGICMEIDTPEDLAVARKLLESRGT